MLLVMTPHPQGAARAQTLLCRRVHCGSRTCAAVRMVQVLPAQARCATAGSLQLGSQRLPLEAPARRAGHRRARPLPAREGAPRRAALRPLPALLLGFECSGQRFKLLPGTCPPLAWSSWQQRPSCTG